MPYHDRRVLVVDDCPINRLILLRQLAKLGVIADTAGDGEAAVRTWLEKKHGLILMDCAMPRLDGYQATRAIRSTAGGEAPCIVAVTAHTDPEIPARCRAVGMDACFFKPLSAATVARALALSGLPIAEAA